MKLTKIELLQRIAKLEERIIELEKSDSILKTLTSGNIALNEFLKRKYNF
jgi:hypothetical protein